MKTKFKQTEIGKIPEDWDVKKIEGSLDKIIDYRGKTPKKSKKGIMTLSAKSIKKGTIDYSKTYSISEETFKEWEKRGKPKIGDIIITTEGPLGEIAQYNKENVALAQRLITVRGKENTLDNHFLKYYLISPMGQHQLQSRATGTTVQGIKQSEFRKILIILPPILEQRLIASVLSSLDDKIELNNKMNKTLEAIGQAIFKKWFVDFEFPDEKGKPYKSSGGGMIKSEFGKIPEEWGIGKYESLVSISTGKGLNKSEYVQKGDYSILGANGELGKTNEFLFDEPLILTGRVGTLGTISLVNGKVWISDNVLISKPKKEENYYYYSYFVLGKLDLKSLNRGSTQPLITQTDLKNQQVIIPKSNISEKFNEVMIKLFGKIDSNKKQNQTLSQIRDVLLPKLMSGEVRVRI